MKGVSELMVTATDQSPKTRRPNSREVSSRFLSPNSSTTSSPKQEHAPHHRSPHRSTKPSTQPDTRNQHRSLDQDSSSGFTRGLWPSSSTTTTSTPSNKKLDTLADHLGNDRLKEFIERKNDKKSSSNKNTFVLGKQRSCSEFSRFTNEKEKQSAKENHRPVLGGSMRYTRNFNFSGKLSSDDNIVVPGRLSIDENTLYSKLNQRSRDSFLDNLESESECSDRFSIATTDCDSPGTIRPKAISTKSGIEVSSKYLQDVNVSSSSARPRRKNSDSNTRDPVSLDSSPKMKKFTVKNEIKRANSLTGYGSATSQWALSPGRSGSSPVSAESKQRPLSFSSLKPPSSSSKTRGVEKLLNFGLDLFKSKKCSSSPAMSGDVEAVHQMRLLHNRLLQWRFTNAKADTVGGNITNQVENNLLYAWENLKKLQHSVSQKKTRLQKEKLQLKLEFILLSQLKPLESWGDMERQHQEAVSTITECLHSVICKVPLIEGAKMDPRAASIALRHASDLAASIKSMLASFSASAEETVLLVSELARVVSQEKLLMEECLELFRTLAMLEIQERSLKCCIMQMRPRRQPPSQQQHQE